MMRRISLGSALRLFDLIRKFKGLLYAVESYTQLSSMTPSSVEGSCPYEHYIASLLMVKNQYYMYIPLLD